MNEKTIEEFKESIDSTSDEINDGINADGLSEEQAKEIYINQLKASKTRFVGTKHDGNTTVSKYGVGFKQTRQKKNKTQRKSRKANRK